MLKSNLLLRIKIYWNIFAQYLKNQIAHEFIIIINQKMRTNTLILLTIILMGMIVVVGCGSTKGYKGDKLTSTETARIQQGNHKLKIKKKNTMESAYLIKVDTVSVGTYMKGFPKYTDIMPGERNIEIRHFRQWDDKAAMAGMMFGVIGASVAESNNPHTHYKLTFNAEKGKVYTIMPITDEVTLVPQFFVIDEAVNDSIHPKVVEIRRKKKENQ